jgi:hypothetical protein
VLASGAAVTDSRDLSVPVLAATTLECAMQRGQPTGITILLALSYGGLMD